MRRGILFGLTVVLSTSVALSQGFDLSLALNKPPSELFREGEQVRIAVRPGATCYLSIVYQDAEGVCTLIYPNDGSSKDGRTAGGQTVTLGKGIKSDGFEFVVTPPFGAETITAYACTKQLPKPAGKPLAGGALELAMRADQIDVYFNDQAAQAGGQLVSATAALRTGAKSEKNYAQADRESNPKRKAGKDVFAKPRIYGLVVGVSTYGDPSIRSLRFADSDARLVSDYLHSPSGGGVSDDHLRVLLNADATRGNILDAFSSFLSTTGENDLVFIYFAGHGITDPDRNATYFLSTDAELKDLANTAVDQAEITRLLTEKVSAGKIVFCIDACHGGGLGLTGIRMRGANTVISNRLLTELVSKKNGTAFLSASRAMEQSMESEKWGGGHGVFTYYLIEGLKKKGDANSDGVVTIDELYEFVRSQVREATGGRQHPELKGYFDNDLVLSVLK